MRRVMPAQSRRAPRNSGLDLVLLPRRTEAHPSEYVSRYAFLQKGNPPLYKAFRNAEMHCCVQATTEKMERAKSRSVHIRDRGVLTLPKSLREKYDLGEGDALHLVDTGGTFVLTPMKPMVPSLSRKIEEMRETTGLSAEELLDGLQEQRTALSQDRYGDPPSDGESQNWSSTNDRPTPDDE